MLTLEQLRAWGADTDSGLRRCMNNEAFYLKLVDRAMRDSASFDALPEAVNSGDLGRAFEIAHALKGVMGNLSLTPLSEPIVEITELLRSRTEMDYTPLLDEIRTRKDALLQLL